MATYIVSTRVDFVQYVEADSEAEAEEMGWAYEMEHYDGVYSIEVEEIYEAEDDDEDGEVE
jgi:hypothetical protein